MRSLLIPLFGTRDTQRILIAAGAFSAALALLAKAIDAAPHARQRRRINLLLITLLAAILITTLPPLPGTLVAYGRNAVAWRGKTDIVYVGEGMNSSVAVSHVSSPNALQFHVAGKIEGSNFPQDMRMQTMLAHIPAFVHPNPRSVLVVGFGTGVTAGSFLDYPTVNRLVICEIEPLIPRVVSKWFLKENNDVAHDPRSQVYLDDARNFVQTTDEQFDVITSEPINPWVKGIATLYTREYFQSAKRRLKPGGVLAQWVPLYETTRDALRSELATFFEVFPNGTIWANTLGGRGYDLVLLGSSEPLRIDVAGMDKRFQAAGYERVGKSLLSAGFTSPAQLFSTYAGSAVDLKTWLDGSAINTDRNLRLQYLAGLGVDNYASAGLYDEILRYRRFPNDLFIASNTDKAMLRDGMGVLK